MIKLNPSFEEASKIAEIVSKAREASLRAGGPNLDRLQFCISITACHLNGCPLDLDRMMVADDFNLLHDVCGIDRHISHDDGSLHNFRPRFAATELLVTVGGSHE